MLVFDDFKFFKLIYFIEVKKGIILKILEFKIIDYICR